MQITPCLLYQASFGGCFSNNNSLISGWKQWKGEGRKKIGKSTKELSRCCFNVSISMFPGSKFYIYGLHTLSLPLDDGLVLLLYLLRQRYLRYITRHVHGGYRTQLIKAATAVALLHFEAPSQSHRRAVPSYWSLQVILLWLCPRYQKVDSTKIKKIEMFQFRWRCKMMKLNIFWLTKYIFCCRRKPKCDLRCQRK